MKTYIKVMITGILASAVIVFFIFYDFNKQEKEAAGDYEKEQAKNENVQAVDIAVQDYLLPLENSKKRLTPISHVMLHFTSNVAENPKDPYLMEDIYTIFEDYGVSAHYAIDREGVIYRLVAENRVAFHAGTGSLQDFPAYEDNLNDYSIGIELLAIGSKEEMNEFIDEATYDSLDPSLIGYTDAQYAAVERLLDMLHEQYPEIERNREYVVGHDEYAPDRKSDPGILFDWSRIGY
ncbi:N-acetylmuramoyl-L-alanine amidase [Oceanobacillus sp. FSL H7-0719]|uniref:N-acetylmuramoyl-L-alanine amidase n=1 Tax=Oceanobacillus sp. FSL H7-0719 TaxID=2954507 RepID=UPI003255A257